MKRTALVLVATFAAGLSASTASARSSHSRQLTFDDRVHAQEAIERVYYSHQLDSRRPFAEAVTKDLLVRKVRDYLRRSAALEKLATGRVTAAALEREMERIARDTRLPDRLEEIYAALGRDPVLVLECFVRPALVQRLTRGIPEKDLANTDTDSIETVVSSDTTLPSPASNGQLVTPDCSSDDTWNQGSLAPALEEGRENHSAVWTGSLMLAWGGGDEFSSPSHGLKYDPVADTWGTITATGAPTPRSRHTVIWTGTEMIVWGGQSQTQTLGTGGRYNPVTDTWLPISSTGAPGPRYSHTAVWSGSAMLIWGGTPNASGHRYNPSTDTWSPISTVNAPPLVQGHTALWTGSEMIVWGGFTGTKYLDSGARYNPVSNTWSPVTQHHPPAARSGHYAVWTGTDMIIWGGVNNQGIVEEGARYNLATDTWQSISTVGAPAWSNTLTTVWAGTRMILYGGACCIGPTALGSGTLYDPSADTWSPMSPLGAPAARTSHSAIWTGNLMVVWGGVGDFAEGVKKTGGRYNPLTDTWVPTSMTSGHAEPRVHHSAVWTGNQMLIWGGSGEFNNATGDGFRYDPLTDSSIGIQLMGAPSPRENHSAVWTGDEMIVWGGAVYNGTAFEYRGDGSRYDPISNTWTPVSATGAPTARSSHGAIWSGSEMIVWGGADGSARQPIGARYNPIADTWVPVSTLNSPSPRYFHSSIWSGTEMIVWGGYDGAYVNSGGRYDPVSDTWLATQSIGAPSPRIRHTAVWTGESMIVWGGDFYNGTTTEYRGDGARYDPISNAWTTTSMTGAPAPRTGHIGVWSGTRMVVFGGGSGTGYFNTGGRYNPYTDTWTQTSTINAPSARTNHTAVWSGGEMIVWGGFDTNGIPMNSGGRYRLRDTSDDDTDGASYCAGDCDDHDAGIYPGAPQICDGKNNDCASAGWPALIGTNETDDDGDSRAECQGDCDDASAAAWSAPGEVPDLTMRADGVTLEWIAPADSGATSVAYDTLRTGIVNDFTGAAVCVESNDGADTVSADASVPAFGGVSYYLVRARNLCPGSVGQGSLGAGSNGTTRPGRSCP